MRLRWFAEGSLAGRNDDVPCAAQTTHVDGDHQSRTIRRDVAYALIPSVPAPALFSRHEIGYESLELQLRLLSSRRPRRSSPSSLRLPDLASGAGEACSPLGPRSPSTTLYLHLSSWVVVLP